MSQDPYDLLRTVFLLTTPIAYLFKKYVPLMKGCVAQTVPTQNYDKKKILEYIHIKATVLKCIQCAVRVATNTLINDCLVFLLKNVCCEKKRIGDTTSVLVRIRHKRRHLRDTLFKAKFYLTPDVLDFLKQENSTKEKTYKIAHQLQKKQPELSQHVLKTLCSIRYVQR